MPNIADYAQRTIAVSSLVLTVSLLPFDRERDLVTPPQNNRISLGSPGQTRETGEADWIPISFLSSDLHTRSGVSASLQKDTPVEWPESKMN